MTARVDPRGVLSSAELEASRLLAEELSALAALGMPRVEPRGKLIRPVVAVASLGEGGVLPGMGAALAAVQLAHEASLIHDDIVDRAAERRGAPSVVAKRGVAAALVQGDHLLTSAYRAAARTGSLAFADAFARAVERTVAGEVLQAELAGRRLDATTQREIASGKSGELFGCALATGALLRGESAAERIAECGRAFGVVYQMVDDLLDYLPAAATGKPPLADYRQRHWTWPLDLTSVQDFDRTPVDVAALFEIPDDDGVTPLQRALARIDGEIARVRADVAKHVGAAPVLDALLRRWRAAVADAAGATAAAAPAYDAPADTDPEPWSRMPADPAGWIDALARGSRSFRFAARLFPPQDRRRIAGVYTFCRFTDDLVDEAGDLDVDAIEARLDAWVALTRRAYEGTPTGVPLLDVVMGDAAQSRVPFRYVLELVEGMRMDLRPRTYTDLDELRTYTYRAAGVVGQWLTELHDVRDPVVLERAATLGHAMQLTNILRDVGEDLDAGRLYLPLSLLDAHGLRPADLQRMRAGAEVAPAYRELIEEAMAVADGGYREAFTAIPALPVSFQRPVAVAARVYQGIHDGIRRNGYDNLSRRAYTSGGAKVRLATRALLDLRTTRRRSPLQPPRTRHVPEVARVAAENAPEAAAR